MPKKGSILEFKNYCNSEKVPFIIYADMESLIKLIQSCEPNPQSSNTKKCQKHEPISFSYYIKCFDDNVFSEEPRTYTIFRCYAKICREFRKKMLKKLLIFLKWI